MTKIHLKKIYIILISIALLFGSIHISQISGTHLKSEFIDTCGDFMCDSSSGEDKLTCSQDCGLLICGDGICEYDENQNTCTSDCGGMVTMCNESTCIPDDGGSKSLGVSQEELEKWVEGIMTPDPEVSQEELQEYLEGIVIPVGVSGFLETAIYTTAAREYILRNSNLGAGGQILWEENPNVKYIGPYCALPLSLTGVSQSTINSTVSSFESSISNETDEKRKKELQKALQKYLTDDYPGVEITANWSGMYGGKVEKKCVSCSNGSWNQNPCRMCPSGKVLRASGCEERNPTTPPVVKEYCGDSVVQSSLGEKCDDGNTVDGDGCDKVCKYEATISGPKSYTSIKEASGPVLYQIDLHSDDTDLTITSVEVTSAKPKNSPQINASHSTKMTWETKEIINNGKSAIITSEDYKWYGTKDLFLAWDSSSQSAYDVEIKATLSNGAVKTYTFILIVKFEDYSVVAEAKIDKLEGKYIKNGSVWNIGVIPEWFPKIYKSCVKGDELEFHVTAHAYNEMKGQYKNFVQEEEDFHVKQMEGEVDWSEGGWKGVEETLGNRLKNAQWCGSGTTEAEAQDEAGQEFRYTLEFIQSLLDNLIEQDTTRCFMEEKAKDKAKLTPEIGGLHLEGAYPFCHRGEKPEKSPIEIINDAFDDAGV